MNRARIALLAGLLSLSVGLPRAAESYPFAAGERGTLLTTVEPGPPVEIPVRYIATYYNFAGPGHDIHLVELEGELAESVGVANGMSGSPVYFDGRLIGALAYRMGAIPRRAIAGVTPIADMHDSRRRVASALEEQAALRPIATPLMVGGLAPALRDWARPLFEAIGMQPVSGGVDAGGLASGSLVPGGPLGVQLVRGDLRIAASGTVTEIDGQTVYAFGHPFFGSGRVEMPMALAEVIHTLADQAGSFHMVNIGEDVGAVLEDRQSAIVGQLGRVAPMIAVELAVRGGDFGAESLSFEIVRNLQLTPLLAALSISNALMLSNGYTDEVTLRASAVIRLDGDRELPLEMAFSSAQGGDPALQLASTIFATLQSLYSNPLEEPTVLAIEASVDFQNELKSYRVEELLYDRMLLEAGRPLTVTAVIRGHRGARSHHQFELDLPQPLPRDGSLILAVGSPSGVDGVLGGLLLRRLESATDLDAVVGALADQRSAHRLTAVIYATGSAAVAGGTAFQGLPPTAEKLLSTLALPTVADANRRAPGTAFDRAEIELDGPVLGGMQVRLKSVRSTRDQEDAE